jgi:hypothetical protein
VRDQVSHPHKTTRVVQKVKTASAHELFADFAWDVLFHPPYSLDLAPRDFHLFTHYKQCLGGTRKGTDEVKKTVKDWFSRLAAHVYDAGIQKLITRYKCLNYYGDYAKKKIYIYIFTVCSNDVK